MKGIELPVSEHVVLAVPPTAAGIQTSDYIHLKESAHIDFIVATGTVSNASTLTVYESQTSGGTVETAIAFSYFEATAGTDTWSALTTATAGRISLGTGNNRMVCVPIDASALTDTYPYVCVKLSTAASSLLSVVCVATTNHQFA